MSQLVTVGSQSPLFYLIDALAHLRRGATQPGPFTPWLNIYNPQDFLSFCAERVFPEPGIGDILFYQRRGEQIRQHVADELGQANPPVVVAATWPRP